MSGNDLKTKPYYNNPVNSLSNQSLNKHMMMSQNTPHKNDNVQIDTNQQPSPIADMIHVAKQSPPIIIKRGPRGFGFTLNAIKVYYGDSDYYTIQHLVINLDPRGPAYAAGLRVNDLITHVNEEVVCGKMHHEIVKCIMSSVNNTLNLRTIQLNDSSIKSGGRRRSPSKSKFSRPFANFHFQNHGYDRYANPAQYQPPASLNSVSRPSPKLNTPPSVKHNSNYYFMNANSMDNNRLG